MISASTDSETFGSFTVFLSFLAYLSGIAMIGLNRHANYYRIENPLIVEDIKYLYLIRILLCCVGYIIATISLPNQAYLKEIFLLALLLSTYREYHRYCRLQNKHKIALNIEIFFARLIPLACILISINYAADLIIDFFIYSYLVGTFLTAIFFVIVIEKKVSLKDNVKIDKPYLFGSWFYDILALASRDLEVIAIGVFVDLKSAGLYYLGKKFFGIMSLINDTSQFLFEQNLSNHETITQLSEYQRQRNINLFFGIIFFALILLMSYVYSANKHILEYYVDDDSVLLNLNLVLVVIVFAIARIVESSIGPYNSFLLMTKNFNRAYLVELLVLLTKFIFCLLATFFTQELWYLVLPFARTATIIVGRKMNII